VHETVGRKCLCNALLANIGHAQVRGEADCLSEEPALITVGDDLNTIAQFLAPGAKSYGAANVVKRLLSETADAKIPDSSLVNQHIAAS
jgi:nitronate monooxygenase